MPSETFPEFAIRNRSAAVALSCEVTAIPPALRGGRTLAAMLRSTSCNVVKAGFVQSTNSAFTKGNCLIDCLIVIQFQGSQTNCFSRNGFRTSQDDPACGSNSVSRMLVA